MNPGELKRALKLFPNTISIVGREALLREQAIALVTKIITPAQDMRDFNTDTITGKVTKEERTLLQEEPVGDDFRVVYLSVDKPDELLEFRGTHTILVTLTRKFSEPDLSIDCKRLYGKDLRRWIRMEARRLGIKLDKKDAAAVLQANPNSLKKIQNELRKLSLVGEKPNPELIQELCKSSISSSGWDVLRHVTNGDVKGAVDALTSLKASGVHPLQIIVAMQVLFQNLFNLLSGVKLDVQDFELERLEKLKKRFSRVQVLESLEDLVITEFNLKLGSSRLDDIWLVSRLARRAL